MEPSLQTICGKTEDSLYDETAGYDEEVGIRLAEGLTDEERQRAVILYNLFQELWGVCIVKGDPGTGKDLFGNYISLMIKRFFPWKRILRDEKPRALFGDYAGLFNEQVLKQDLLNMRRVARGEKKVAQAREDYVVYGDALQKAADQWVTESGEVLLKNSLLYLTEYWRYCYNREPHNPMNKTMGAIHKVKRHLDILIIGTVQLPSELDKKTCLPWIDWQVTCTRSTTNKTGFVYHVQRVKYDRRMDMLASLGKPFPIAFDAGSPRSYLGDGKIHIKKHHYTAQTEEERIVLEVLKGGVDTYNELLDVIKAYGDMSEKEVLDTLKELKFRKSKRVIDYPCMFMIYNSKSAPQLKTALKVEDNA